MKNNWCKHHRSWRDNETCLKGHNYKKLYRIPTRPLLRTIPCNSNNETSVVCPDREFPTEAELAEQEKEFRERFDFTQAAIVLIAKKSDAKPTWDEGDKREKGSEGTIICPKCNGTLHYTVSGYNNHIWGKCETEGCLSWMM